MSAAREAAAVAGLGSASMSDESWDTGFGYLNMPLVQAFGMLAWSGPLFG
jgi:hypothetical protein